MLRLLLVATIASAIAGCKDKPSEAECAKLLDHVIAVEYAEAAGSQEAATVKASVKKEFIAECIDNMPKHKVLCGLKATDNKGLLDCDLTAKEKKAAAEAPPVPEPEPEPEPEAKVDAGAAEAAEAPAADAAP